MRKTISILKSLPATLFFNKQTSVALAMAVGATAAYGAMASPTASTLEVNGTGEYPVQVECQTPRNKVVPVEQMSHPDAKTTIRFQLITSRPLRCEVTSGTLKKSLTVAPGERASLDFKRP